VRRRGQQLPVVIFDRRAMPTPVREPNEPQLERRAVEIHEPALSASTNAQLTDEVRDVIGADEVEVLANRPHPSAGEPVEHRRSLPLPFPLPNNFVVAQGGLALVVVGAIAALAVVTHVWWTLVLAFLVLAAMTYVVVTMIIKMTSNPERPEPATVAAMEQEGVGDPEQLFSDVVAESPRSRRRVARPAEPPTLWMITRRRPRNSVMRPRRAAGRANRSAPPE
jgi:hypothetical protein